MSGPTLGILGGSGLYDLPDLKDVERIELSTPFGEPSDAYVRGRLGETTLVFLPRHGVGHRLMPSEINNRANIWGLKKLGVEQILSVSAVGSMKEEIHPGDVVIVDQLFDWTRQRVPTFFGDGIVAHVAFGDPICNRLGGLITAAAKATQPEEGGAVHEGGTYICMEGPAFSTRAESNIYRSWGVSVIGMTNLPEAKLAREAELCYATLALATDYDCWHDGHDDVSVASVLETLRQNVQRAQAVIRGVAERLSTERPCACPNALQHAIMTSPDHIPAEARERLALLVDRHLS
ncbi:MAG: S-methyl-5'-thioadenosine phosphorylase [Deltaproteobacteria bacterium]|nr:S-methyl-5'-thioadenosine phosphorylase [Deltaproteobacteria bacterium]